MPTKYLYTEEKTNFVKENYYRIGKNNCVKQIGYTRQQVEYLAQKFKLVSSHNKAGVYDPPEEFLKINVEAFRNVTCPKVSYIMGLIWADGCVRKPNAYGYQVKVSIWVEDFKDIKHLFDSVGDWNYGIIKGAKSWYKDMFYANIGCKKLFHIFENLDYSIKSGASASKVLSHIPEHLHNYWWRGFFDGDGCLTFNEKCNEIMFCSCFSQEWNFAENLAKKLNIDNFHIYRKNSKKFGAGSTFGYSKIYSIVKIMKYIYSGDQFGLSRKMEKWNDFKIHIANRLSKKTSKLEKSQRQNILKLCSD